MTKLIFNKNAILIYFGYFSNYLLLNLFSIKSDDIGNICIEDICAKSTCIRNICIRNTYFKNIYIKGV